MNDIFLPYPLALGLKQLGFKERVLTYFEDEIPKLHTNITGWDFNSSFLNCVSRPTFSEAFKWFRENHNLLGGVYSNASGWEWEIHDHEGGTHRYGSDFDGDCESSGSYTSYEKAEAACIEKLIQVTSKEKR